MKHIEQIQSEYAAGDLSRLLVSDADATASAALTALLHNVTGCAIPPTADTPESEVEELVPLCLSILRRHWTTPLTALGDGTTPMSLADLLRRLIGDRVQGNEAWSIPAIHADIPTALAALRQRDMSSGLTLTLTDGTDGSTTSPTTTSLPDGLSLAQLLCGTSPDGTDLASFVTEIVDTNKGWVGRKSLDILTTNLSALKRIQCNAVEWASGVNILQSGVIEEISLPYLEKINQNGFNLLNIENIELPSVKSILIRIYNGKEGGGNVFSNASKIKHISLPVCESLIVGNYLRSFCRNNSLQETLYMPNCSLVRAESDGMSINNNPMLHTVVFGILKEFNTSSTQQVLGECPNLVHLEIQGAEASINLRYWSPTTALAERLPEFLSNFKQFIAQRLTDKGSGLTLTLSQAVRDAIQTDPEIVSIITSKGWTISPAPSV